LVIEDDHDADLRYDRTPIGALQAQAPQHVAYLRSASKTVSPALRLGWIVAPAHLADALEHEKRHDDMGSSLLDQLAFARFVHSGELARHLRRRARAGARLRHARRGKGAAHDHHAGAGSVGCVRRRRTGSVQRRTR
jgi:GntR family transcriptional regulator / MocR family aminotransferase